MYFMGVLIVFACYLLLDISAETLVLSVAIMWSAHMISEAILNSKK